MSKNLTIYQAENGAIELNFDATSDTIWASQKQIAQIFGVTPQNITTHLKQIFTEGELEKEATCKHSLQVQKEGSREVKRKIEYYNLDMIISVGYRVNSKKATQFRQWATKTLKQHITKGYTINPKRIEKNYQAFMTAVDDVKQLAKNKLGSDEALDLIKIFANTWFSLESFDENKLPKHGLSKKEVSLQARDLYQAVTEFKADLMAKKQATILFAQEKKKNSLAGIFGNVMQSVFGQEAYSSIEEKAAHLLYFIIKNHPFNDGNKRTGAFAFVWFLQKSGVEFTQTIKPETLTTLTLLIAQSNPKEKDKIIGLVLLLLNGKNHGTN